MPRPLNSRGRPPYPDTLTPSEWSVLHLLRHGLTNRAIAHARGTSIDAVKFHVRNIATKLGAARRVDLRHWPGIPAQSALHHAREEGTMTTPDPRSLPGVTGLGQVSLLVHDTVRAEAFFRDVLGLQHLFTFGTLAFFDLDGVRL